MYSNKTNRKIENNLTPNIFFDKERVSGCVPKHALFSALYAAVNQSHALTATLVIFCEFQHIVDAPTEINLLSRSGVHPPEKEGSKDYILHISESKKLMPEPLNSIGNTGLRSISDTITFEDTVIGRISMGLNIDIEHNIMHHPDIKHAAALINSVISNSTRLKENNHTSNIGQPKPNTSTPPALNTPPISNTDVWHLDAKKDHPALIKAVNYMHSNYDKTFTMRDLSSECYVSASHLTHLFKCRFGVSFKKILIHIRIDKAKNIFRNIPVRQITQVCRDVGFCDLSHFEKTFKKYVGVSPSVYRKQFRKPLFEQSK